MHNLIVIAALAVLAAAPFMSAPPPGESPGLSDEASLDEPSGPVENDSDGE